MKTTSVSDHLSSIFRVATTGLLLVSPLALAQSNADCGYPNGDGPPKCKEDAGSNKFSVNTSEVHREITDLRVFGGGSWMPLEFTRTYASRYKYGLSWFGPAKHFTHSHQWTMHYIAGVPLPGGGSGNARRIVDPSGHAEIYYETSDKMTFKGVLQDVHKPRVARSNLLLRNGNVFTLLEPGGAHTVFDRVTLPDGSVRYDVNSAVDTQGNVFAYENDSEGKVTKVSDPAGQALHIYYKPVQSIVPQDLFEVTATPPEAWVDVIPSDTTTPFKCLQVISGEDAGVNLAEVEFYTEVPDGNGGVVEQKLTGTPYGTSPSKAVGSEFGKMFDGDTNTHFQFVRSWYGFAGLELVQPTRVTRIRFFPRKNIDRSVLKRANSSDGAKRGTIFQGLTTTSQAVTVIDKVTTYDTSDPNASGREVNYEYENFTDPLCGLQYLVLKAAHYGDGTSGEYTYYQQLEGGRPLIRTANDPRYNGDAMRIAYRYLPNGLGTQGMIWQEWANFNETSGNYEGLLVEMDASSSERKVTYADGRIDRFKFDPAWMGNLPWTQNGAGDRTMMTYQADPNNPSIQTGYVLSETDPNGNTTSYQRNLRGQPTRIDYADGAWTETDYDSVGRVLETRSGGADIATRITTHIYDASGNRTSTTYPDGTGETWENFNAFGQFQKHTARNGAVTVYAYNAVGLLTGMTEASGTAAARSTGYGYYLPGEAGGPAGLMKSMTNPRGLTTAYEYDERGLMTKTTYPDATFASRDHDMYGNVTTSIDELGHETVIAWNDFRQRNSVTVAAGTAEARTTGFQYGPLGSSGCTPCGAGRPGPTITTYPSGRKEMRVYDLALRVKSITMGYGSAEAATTTFFYDGNGNITSTMDASGTVVTKRTYDSRNRLLTDTDALKLVTRHEYDTAGNKLKTFRPDNSVLVYGYDIIDRMVSSKDAKNQTTTYVFNYPGDSNADPLPAGTGHTRTLIDPKGNARKFSHDLFDRLIEKKYPDNTTETYAYNDTAPVGQVAMTHTRPDGDQRVCTYDARDRDLTCTWTDGVTPNTTREYDLTGKLTRILRGSRETIYTYDAADFLRSETSTLLTNSFSFGTVGYTYDADGNRATMVHPDGHTISYGYTQRNQMKTVTSGTPPPLATYAWRADGTLDSLQVDGRYQTAYQYDPAKRLTRVSTQDLVSQNAVNSHSYAIDNVGLRRSQLFGDGTKDLYGYDAADQVTAAQYDAQSAPGNTLAAYIDFGPSTSSVQPGYRRDGGAAFGIRSDGFSYGWNSNLTSVARDRNSPNSADQRHDTFLHMAHPSSPAGRKWEMAVASGDYRVTIAVGDPDNVDSVHAVDAEGVQLLAPFTPTVANRFAYATATVTVSDGRLTLTQPAGGSNTKLCFAHIERIFSTVPAQSASFAYDASGNRSVTADADQPASSYTANNLDQYSFVGSAAQSHDLDGNLLTDGLRSYTWDSEGKLLSLQATSPVTGDLRIEADYDGQSRRVERRTYTWQSGAFVQTEVTHYLYDGWNVIEEKTDNPPGTQMAYRRYTWGLDMSRTLQGAGGVGGLLMAEELTSTQTIPYYYNYDGNGNVTAITDSNGTNVATYRYTAFGRLKSSTGSYAATNAYRFSTKPQDADVKTAVGSQGLYYYGYRYYDPTTGRWPSRDPIEEQGGINLYGFVGNDGVNKIDHLGMRCCCEFLCARLTTLAATFICSKTDEYCYDNSTCKCPRITVVSNPPGISPVRVVFWLKACTDGTLKYKAIFQESWVNPPGDFGPSIS